MKKIVGFLILAVFFMGMAKQPAAPKKEDVLPKAKPNPETFAVVCDDGTQFFVPSISLLNEQEAKGVIRILANQMYFPDNKENPCNFMPISMTRFFKKPAPKMPTIKAAEPEKIKAPDETPNMTPIKTESPLPQEKK